MDRYRIPACWRVLQYLKNVVDRALNRWTCRLDGNTFDSIGPMRRNKLAENLIDTRFGCLLYTREI